jgi:predicted ATP-dependent serine protease
MPRNYIYQCNDCGHKEIRYRNARACRKCHSHNIERSEKAKAAFLEAMKHLLYDSEPETEEEIDAFLRSEGVDPEECAERGRELAARFFMRRKAE